MVSGSDLSSLIATCRLLVRFQHGASALARQCCTSLLSFLPSVPGRLRARVSVPAMMSSCGSEDGVVIKFSRCMY